MVRVTGHRVCLEYLCRSTSSLVKLPTTVRSGENEARLPHSNVRDTSVPIYTISIQECPPLPREREQIVLFAYSSGFRSVPVVPQSGLDLAPILEAPILTMHGASAYNAHV